jgi:hypothetical protein
MNLRGIGVPCGCRTNELFQWDMTRRAELQKTCRNVESFIARGAPQLPQQVILHR